MRKKTTEQILTVSENPTFSHILVESASAMLSGMTTAIKIYELVLVVLMF